MHWIQLAQDRVCCSGSCEHGYEPSGSIKDGEFLDNLRTCVSRRTLLHGVVNQSKLQVEAVRVITYSEETHNSVEDRF
jgi:hypothetical protein